MAVAVAVAEVAHPLSRRSKKQWPGAAGFLAAQHISAALLVSYLVLPPVAMKHFQALDCIPFNHDGSSYLRVDTAIDCDSSSYQAFRTAVLLFLVLYQSVPLLWFVMLHKQPRRQTQRWRCL